MRPCSIGHCWQNGRSEFLSHRGSQRLSLCDLAELAEVPWLRVLWTQVLSFMHRLARMSEDSLHADTLRDNIHAAEHSLLDANLVIYHI